MRRGFRGYASNSAEQISGPVASSELAGTLLSTPTKLVLRVECYRLDMSCNTFAIGKREFQVRRVVMSANFAVSTLRRQVKNSRTLGEFLIVRGLT